MLVPVARVGTIQANGRPLKLTRSYRGATLFYRETEVVLTYLHGRFSARFAVWVFSLTLPLHPLGWAIWACLRVVW